jgi:hypothetical protein
MMLCPAGHFLMSLPKANAEAIFEISRQIAIAKMPFEIVSGRLPFTPEENGTS